MIIVGTTIDHSDASELSALLCIPSRSFHFRSSDAFFPGRLQSDLFQVVLQSVE